MKHPSFPPTATRTRRGPAHPPLGQGQHAGVSECSKARPPMAIGDVAGRILRSGRNGSSLGVPCVCRVICTCTVQVRRESSMSELADNGRAGISRPRTEMVITSDRQIVPSAQAPAAARNGFVGREPELCRLAELLSGETRLITLLGSSGVGKTWLAAEAIRRLETTRSVSATWVHLSRLPAGSAADAVEAEFTGAVLEEESDSAASDWDAAIAALRRPNPARSKQHRILVVENCEHVIAGAGRVITALLREVPELTVLATSCEPIGWIDEQWLAVPPLTPDQALLLFQEGAAMVSHPVSGSAETMMARQICRRVHHQPLFVRIAAARLRHQPIAAVSRELSGTAADRRLRWSRWPRVGVEPRHQRIGDAIAWSYDLCDDRERELLQRMSVFASGCDVNPEAKTTRSGGGADLDAIQRVCGNDPLDDSDDLQADEFEAILGRLADRALISVWITADNVYYYLSESVRLFASAQLRATPFGQAKASRLIERHRRYYRDCLLRGRGDWSGPAEQKILAWVRPAWPNILDAMDGTGMDAITAAVDVELAAELFPLPALFVNGPVGPLRRRFEQAIANPAVRIGRMPEDLIKAMSMVAWLAICQGARDIADPIIERCVAEAGVSAPADWRQRPEADLDLPAAIELVWGCELLMLDGNVHAASVLARAREKYRRAGDEIGASISELFEVAAMTQAEPDRALESARRLYTRASASGASHGAALAAVVLTAASTDCGQFDEALEIGRDALAFFVACDDRWDAMWAIQQRIWTLVGMVADRRGSRSEIAARATEAARLQGGLRTFRKRLGVETGNMRPLVEQNRRVTEVLRETLGDADYAAAVEQGALLRPEAGELQRLALGTLSIESMSPSHPARQYMPSNWEDLTMAEEKIALLAAAGWTNTAIAERRGSSFKTVNAQMASIFQKLMINSRDDIIGLVPEQHMDVVRAESGRQPRRHNERASA
ncbi:AAA family ATPase [Nocardia sp. NPDC006044]|uniref:AAA family ATPase n=1 Tax=Nocardia sp. NPDC006044 TaxID=3364306 RepID=UPI0036ABFE69